MSRELRPYQVNALKAIRETVGQGVYRLVVQAPTGAGKTRVAADIVEGAQRKGNRLAFVVSSLSLIDQTVEALYAEGIRDVGVIQANHERTDWSKPVQVCSIQTIKSRGAYPEAKVVVIDECFAAGTMISTPSGNRPIESLREGDRVLNAIGTGYAEKVSRRAARTITLGLSNGQQLCVTPDHPFFTATGWAKARELVAGSNLFSEQAMRALWQNIPPIDRRDSSTVSKTGGVDEATILLDLLCEEATKSDAGCFCSSEVERYLEAYWARTSNARWQWQRTHIASESVVTVVGRRMGSGGGNWNRPARRPLSDKLQARSGEPCLDDRNRAGWWVACGETSPTGSKERCVFGDVRVESISIEEPARIGAVFNLQVSGHPSYFAGGVLVHNCHVLHKAHVKWMIDPAWQNVPFIGLSATPWTKGLGRYFETLLVMSTTQELVDQGWLSPFRVFAADHPDLSKVKTVAGDYHEGQLSTVMRAEGLTANVIETWKQRWHKDKTLCFGVDCAHAQALQARFHDAGISCAYQDAHTTGGERADIKRKFHSGEYRVVCNVGTLTTGVDWDVRCLILARPTKSEMLFVQIIGRSLRTAEGKEHALILDHTDTTSRLGFVTDIHHEVLDGGRLDTSVKVLKKPPLPKPCPQCTCLIPPRVMVCPSCGFERKIMSDVHEREGQLVEIEGYSKTKAPPRAYGQTNDRIFPYTQQEKQRYYAQLRGYGLMKGYADGWAWHKYQEKFDERPPKSWNRLTPMTPGPEVTSYIRSRQIAYAESKKRQEERDRVQKETEARRARGDDAPAA